MTQIGGLMADQIQHFITHGYVTITDCFSREAAAAYVADAYHVLGYDPNDLTTWERDLFIGEAGPDARLRDFSPKLWAAICQLLGGEERLQWPDATLGWWVVNFSRGADTPWQPPGAELGGWHTDGNGHRHFLDSPEQGLLVLPLFSDVEHKGGGTLLATDSLPVMAEFLRERPEGVPPREFPYPSLVSQCREFMETTGRAGDVTLVHPHLLHNFSQNHSGRPRFMKNVNVTLKEPMDLNRTDGSAYSPVEAAILHSLRVEALDFKITHPRESIVWQ